MITAVDSNVLLDVLSASPEHGVASRRAIREALLEGSLMACDVVWAEVGAWFPSVETAIDAMGELRVGFAPLDPEVAIAAGGVWQTYRRRGGARDRIMADFLIGAHASLRADRLLTRDRGFYRAYFKRLQVLDPSRAV